MALMSSFQAVLFVTVLFGLSDALQWIFSDALQCASCTNITRAADCQKFITCSPGERCYSTSFGIGNEALFDLGCKTEKDCFSSAGLSVIGRSVSNVQCSQCCAVDSCNIHLCSAGTQITNEVGSCADDPNYDCKQFSTLFNICADVAHAKTACRKWCGLCDLVDGAWSVWTAWSNCDVTCGSGHVTRFRSCSDPPPAHGGLPCTGNTTETNTCTLDLCPIHGGWSSWESWSVCSSTCGIGTMRRHRSCDNPTPAIGGNHCFGDGVDFQACFDGSCTVHGGWSSWESWSVCSSTCGIGTMRRHRSCDNPTPAIGGNHCFGDGVDFQACFDGSCTDGGWSTWSRWSACTDGMQSRNRSCDSPPPSQFGRYCVGSDLTSEKCGHIAFTVHTPNGTITNGTLIFTKVVTNLGGGFDPATGRFTCTLQGLYFFTISVATTSNGNVYCHIRKNGSPVTYAISYGVGSYNTVSASAYLSLAVGDKVDVGDCTAYSQYIVKNYGSSFSGALV